MDSEPTIRYCASNDPFARRLRQFGDKRESSQVRTPKLSFKFSSAMAHRDQLGHSGPHGAIASAAIKNCLGHLYDRLATFIKSG
jgi:hypothetical protein